MDMSFVFVRMVKHMSIFQIYYVKLAHQNGWPRCPSTAALSKSLICLTSDINFALKGPLCFSARPSYNIREYVLSLTWSAATYHLLHLDKNLIDTIHHVWFLPCDVTICRLHTWPDGMTCRVERVYVTRCSTLFMLEQGIETCSKIEQQSAMFWSLPSTQKRHIPSWISPCSCKS